MLPHPTTSSFASRMTDGPRWKSGGRMFAAEARLERRRGEVGEIVQPALEFLALGIFQRRRSLSDGVARDHAALGERRFETGDRQARGAGRAGEGACHAETVEDRRGTHY